MTLRNLGANDKQITRVFLFEGRMIAVIGAVIGIGLGLLLCFCSSNMDLYVWEILKAPLLLMLIR